MNKTIHLEEVGNDFFAYATADFHAGSELVYNAIKKNEQLRDMILTGVAMWGKETNTDICHILQIAISKSKKP